MAAARRKGWLIRAGESGSSDGDLDHLRSDQDLIHQWSDARERWKLFKWVCEGSKDFFGAAGEAVDSEKEEEKGEKDDLNKSFLGSTFLESKLEVFHGQFRCEIADAYVSEARAEAAEAEARIALTQDFLQLNQQSQVSQVEDAQFKLVEEKWGEYRPDQHEDGKGPRRHRYLGQIRTVSDRKRATVVGLWREAGEWWARAVESWEGILSEDATEGVDREDNSEDNREDNKNTKSQFAEMEGGELGDHKSETDRNSEMLMENFKWEGNRVQENNQDDHVILVGADCAKQFQFGCGFCSGLRGLSLSSVVKGGTDPKIQSDCNSGSDRNGGSGHRISPPLRNIAVIDKAYATKRLETIRDLIRLSDLNGPGSVNRKVGNNKVHNTSQIVSRCVDVRDLHLAEKQSNVVDNLVHTQDGLVEKPAPWNSPRWTAMKDKILGMKLIAKAKPAKVQKEMSDAEKEEIVSAQQERAFIQQLEKEAGPLFPDNERVVVRDFMSVANQFVNSRSITLKRINRNKAHESGVSSPRGAPVDVDALAKMSQILSASKISKISAHNTKSLSPNSPPLESEPSPSKSPESPSKISLPSKSSSLGLRESPSLLPRSNPPAADLNAAIGIDVVRLSGSQPSQSHSGSQKLNQNQTLYRVTLTVHSVYHEPTSLDFNDNLSLRKLVLMCKYEAT